MNIKLCDRYRVNSGISLDQGRRYATTCMAIKPESIKTLGDGVVGAGPFVYSLIVYIVFGYRLYVSTKTNF